MEEEENEDVFIKENPILFKKYRLKKKLGEGAFGDVYLGQEISNNGYVAIKTELRKIVKPILESEAFLLYSIAGPGIPEVKSFGKTKKYNVLVEPLLGKSLFDIFTENHKNMHLADACLIANQVLDRIQWVHSKYIVHRDIKPDNFLIGRKDPNVIYLIDFGLSKKYRSSNTGKHIRFGFTGKLTGTVRFASANALRGGEQSRRDDIESIGYMMIYFLKRKLPWQGITGNKKMERYLKIYKMKKNTPPEKLCEGLFPEMVDYITYAKNLEFEQEPNYNYLKSLFKKMLKRIHKSEEQLVFSWIKTTDMKNMKNPINPASRKDSPQNRIYKKIKSKLERDKNISSDSDYKTCSYGQTGSQLATSTNLNVVDNKYVVYSEDQFEETKEKDTKKKFLKSIKSKEALNTTIANLDASFNGKIVDFENERLKGSSEIFDDSNNNLNLINRNLKSEFNQDTNQEQNKIENKNNTIKKENSSKLKNKKPFNRNLSENISDNSNNVGDIENIKEENNKQEKKTILSKEIKQKLNDNNKNSKIKENKKEQINNDIPKIVLDGTEFTFNESISNNQIKTNLDAKLKNNLTEVKTNNEIDKNIYDLLTGKNVKQINHQKRIQGISNSYKNSINDTDKTNLTKVVNQNVKNNIINENIVTSNKIVRYNTKKLPINNKNIKKMYINTQNQDKNINKHKRQPNNSEIRENYKNDRGIDLIKQISKETNNNLYNAFKEEMNFNININDLKKRPSFEPGFNQLTLNKILMNKNNNIINLNGKNTMNKDLKKKLKCNLIINNREQDKRKIHKTNLKKNLTSNNMNSVQENNNNDLCDKISNNKSNITDLTKKEEIIKKFSNNAIYQGIGYQTFNNKTNPESITKKSNFQKLNPKKIPEDNYMNNNLENEANSKFKKSITKNKKLNKSICNYDENINNIYPMNNENMNSIEFNSNQNKYMNGRKEQKSFSPHNNNRVKKSIKIVRLKDDNKNTINKVTKINKSNNKSLALNRNINPKINTIQSNEIRKLQLMNNKNQSYKSNIPNWNNIISNSNNILTYKKIVPNSQINYQFPVYINNNNNIYNTQYLNTVDNFPINSSVNQINQKFITLSPTPTISNANLNFGPNFGVQFVNNTPNNYNNFGNIKYYPIQNRNAYQYQKKYNVSLVEK